MVCNKRFVVSEADIINNINLLREEIKAPIIAVIKGNGYGLGLLNMANVLRMAEIKYFAVADYNEALTLRLNEFSEEILLLTPVRDSEILNALIDNNITLTVASFEDAALISEIAKEKNITAKAHIKIDSGFGRFGFTEENKEKIIETLKMPNIDFEGVYTHFSCSFEKKYKITKKQLETFTEILTYIEDLGYKFKIRHAANSCAALRFKETRLDAVRIGSAILGRLPVINSLGLKKIGYLESKVLYINTLQKDSNVGYGNVYKTDKITRTAIVPIGYIDGFGVEKKNDTFRFIDILRYIYNTVRMFNKKNYVSINNQRARIIGRIGMYNIVCDVSDLKVEINDTVNADINPIYLNSNIKRDFI